METISFEAGRIEEAGLPVAVVARCLWIWQQRIHQTIVMGPHVSPCGNDGIEDETPCIGGALYLADSATAHGR